MKMKQWYQGHDRVSDQKAPAGTDRASYHAREPIEDDEERLAMRQGDMPPPVPETSYRSENSRRPSTVQDLPMELGKDAPCHLRRCLQAKKISWSSRGNQGPAAFLYIAGGCLASVLLSGARVLKFTGDWTKLS